jgi:hypothetical protein
MRKALIDHSVSADVFDDIYAKIAPGRRAPSEEAR